MQGPRARVNTYLDLHEGSAQKKIELPLKLLALVSFSNSKEARSLSECKPVNVNKLNFDNVLSELEPEVSYAVRNTLADDCSEENIPSIFLR